MQEPEEFGLIPRVGTKSVLVPHIFRCNENGPFVVHSTSLVKKQLMILSEDALSQNYLLSPPSEGFMPT